MVPEAEPAPCPLCAATGAEPLTVGYDRLRATERNYPYVRCLHCGLVRRQPLPDEGEIPSLYPDSYDPHLGSSRRKKDKWINRLATRYYYGTESVGRSRLLRVA